VSVAARHSPKPKLQVARWSASVREFILTKELINIVGPKWRRRNLKRILFAAGVIFLFVVILISWWAIATSPVNSKDAVARRFTISKGEGVREISKDLRDVGLVRDQIAFFLLIKYQLGIEKNIQAGTFELSPSMTAAQVATQLTSGTEDIWITIPEGWRSEEVLEYLEKQGFNTVGENWKSDEGKLFPDTYRLPKESSVSAVHDLLRQTFDAKTAGIAVSQQTLILASIVEREAKFASDRPMVASVLLNRLNIGMKLDIDATVQYVLGKTSNWWPKDLSLDDIKVKSPYNTYTNAGLPPTPICNPGLSAIQSVLNPAKTNYIYYVSDKQGHLHFASNLEDHNANVAKYISQ